MLFGSIAKSQSLRSLIKRFGLLNNTLVVLVFIRRKFFKYLTHVPYVGIGDLRSQARSPVVKSRMTVNFEKRCCEKVPNILTVV